jgi:hypothetical protein
MLFFSTLSSRFWGRSPELGWCLEALPGLGQAETRDKRRLDNFGPGPRGSQAETH